MKTQDIAVANGFDTNTLELWIKQAGVPHKVGFFSSDMEIDDMHVPSVVAQFRTYLEQTARDRHAAAIAEDEKRRAMASMLITSGFNFDGYTITRYSGYISGDDAMSLDRPRHGWFGGVDSDVASGLMRSLVEIRRNALAELKEAAYALGCNAVIGVDFDYITLDPETRNNQGGTLYLPFLFAVTANGNAVVIEKNK